MELPTVQDIVVMYNVSMNPKKVNGLDYRATDNPKCNSKLEATKLK